MRRSNLAYLYLVEGFAGLSRGSFLVCIGWMTLVETGEVARVGQVFILGMLVILLAGPPLGAVVDRYNRKWLCLVAHLGIALVMVAAGWAIVSDVAAPTPLFFTTTVAVYLLRYLYHLSHDGLIRANVAEAQIVTTIARARVIHLAATSIGTVAAGVVLARYGAFAGFALSGLTSALLLLPLWPVRSAAGRGGRAGFRGFAADIAAGLPFVLRDPGLRVVAVIAALALPVGQLSNAVLSGFIRQDLGLGADVFGLVDAAWPLGGMAAAGVLSLGLWAGGGRTAIYAAAILSGLSTVAFGLAAAVPLLVILHGAMGFWVWLARIRIDGAVLEAAGDEMVGRAKAAMEIVFSLAAIIMCLSPSVLTLAAGTYFVLWGAVAVIAGVALLLMTRAPLDAPDARR